MDRNVDVRMEENFHVRVAKELLNAFEPLQQHDNTHYIIAFFITFLMVVIIVCEAIGDPVGVYLCAIIALIIIPPFFVYVGAIVFISLSAIITGAQIFLDVVEETIKIDEAEQKMNTCILKILNLLSPFMTTPGFRVNSTHVNVPLLARFIIIMMRTYVHYCNMMDQQNWTDKEFDRQQNELKEDLVRFNRLVVATVEGVPLHLAPTAFSKAYRDELQHATAMPKLVV
jgi:hypothetical protein